MKIACVGVGAIGGSLAGFIAKAGADILLIDGWKEHVEVMNENGLTLDGIVGSHNVPVNAIHENEVSTIKEKFDLVIIGVKSYNTVTAVKSMIPFMKTDTWVVSPQNSINELQIAPLVGASRTVGCITTISAGLYEPGHIIRTGSVSQSLQTDPICFTVGELNGELTDRVQKIADIFQPAGKTIVTDDLWGQRWSKMVTNCMVNATAAMTGLMSHEVRADEDARHQILNLAIETVKVGRSQGYDVKPPMGDFTLEDMESAVGPKGHEQLDQVLKGTTPAVPGRPSMAQDIIKGRLTEIEYLNGFVSQKGREMGIETPYSDAVTQVLKGVESGEFEVGMSNIEKVQKIVETS